MKKISFIGLGNMGLPMASNLINAGHKVHAFDISEESLQKISALGGNAEKSASDSVKGADFIISMLPSGRHVLDLYIGNTDRKGLLFDIQAGSLIIDCSTIEPEASIQVAEAAQNLGINFIDAPVSGGTAGAAAGSLTFMVGADKKNFETAKPILEKMGKNIFHAGDIGAGQTTKICNNMLLGILMAGTSEAISLGVSKGLDPKILSEIMRVSSGGNWSLEKYNPYPNVQENSPASNNYQGGFSSNLMLKDLSLAADTANKSTVPTPLGNLAKALYSFHVLNGNGNKDFSSIIQTMLPR